MESAAFWNKIADSYARKPVSNPDAFEKKIAITKAKMGPGLTVLDIGCGTGSLALRLSETGSQVHGLDISPEMIRIAEAKAASQDVTNVTFHTGPFDETFRTFAPGSLDGICAYSFLHLVEDVDAALSHIFSLLKPGGFLVASTVTLRESWIPYAAVLALMRWVGKAPRVKMLSKRDVHEALQSAGFGHLTAPDVGAESIVDFLTAQKP